MTAIKIRGMQSLKGEIKIQGSKNAVLPMMAASILHKGLSIIYNVPGIQDVFCMMGILDYIGCRCTLKDHVLMIDASEITCTELREELVRSMRSSIILLGAMLGRTGEVHTHYPGGCSIGKRPIDLHLLALEKLGTEIITEGESITAKSAGLKGSMVSFSFPSVGATENTILAAVLADGDTVLRGGAKEPEIIELCSFLKNMGALIEMIGDELIIHGVKSLHGADYCLKGDRIVAGSYMTCVLSAGGDALLKNVPCFHMTETFRILEKAGARIQREHSMVRITAGDRPKPVTIVTAPYPGFPTDMQSLLMSVLAVADGKSVIEEKIFEARFKTAKELQKMGADIIIKDRYAFIQGVPFLKGTFVKAEDLRGGAALAVAALAAEGITTIDGYEHICRGYEDICRDLTMLGADVLPV